MMKKLTYILLGLFIGSILGQAQDTIPSKNAAGYVKVEGHKGKFHLVSIPFIDFESNSMRPSDVFGNQNNLPTGTTLYFFDPAQQIYTGTESLFPFGWYPNTADLDKAAFWLYLPDDGGASPINIYMYGEVPDAGTAPIQSVQISGTGSSNSKAFNLLGYYYPIAKKWTDTTLAQNAAVGDVIYKYSPTGGYSETASRFPFGWYPDSLTLHPGDAFWYATSQTKTWNETKPYSWP